MLVVCIRYGYDLDLSYTVVVHYINPSQKSIETKETDNQICVYVKHQYNALYDVYKMDTKTINMIKNNLNQ